MIIGVNARLLLNHRMEGIARYCWETTQLLIKKHPEHSFVLFFDRAYDRSFKIADNVQCVSLFPPARHPILWKWWFDYSLTKAMKKYNVDVLLSGDGFMSLRSKIPTLLVSHDIAYYHFPQYMKKGQLNYYRKNVPIFHERAKHIIAVSESTKADLIRQFGLKPKKITVAYNALPSTIPLGLNPKNKNYYLYLGSVHPRKNIINLLLAFDTFVERLKGEGNYDELPKLLLAGRSAFDNDEVFSKHNNMKNKALVEFRGSVDEAEKWKLLAEAKCMCYISKWEGFGIPILEAMHAETPVITSDEGAQAEVGNDACLQVSPHNFNAIAEKMYEVYTNKKLRDELIEKGKKRVKDFNWEVSADIIFKELEKLMQN
jgi:glycosyltransferase involved in cell wall biosynthesis